MRRLHWHVKKNDPQSLSRLSTYLLFSSFSRLTFRDATTEIIHIQFNHHLGYSTPVFSPSTGPLNTDFHALFYHTPPLSQTWNLSHHAVYYLDYKRHSFTPALPITPPRYNPLKNHTSAGTQAPRGLCPQTQKRQSFLTWSLTLPRSCLAHTCTTNFLSFLVLKFKF